jgi:general stress protein 26
MDPRLSKILDFIRSEMLTVISTVGDNAKPEGAVIAFAETENLELIFGTSNSTRKYANIQKNPNVAFVIGWDADAFITVQYEGVAKELTSDDAKTYNAIMAAKNPRAKKFGNRADQRYFFVKPTWVRYTSQNEVFEMTF